MPYTHDIRWSWPSSRHPSTLCRPPSTVGLVSLTADCNQYLHFKLGNLQQLKSLSQFCSLSRQIRPINVDKLLFMTFLSEFLSNNGPSQVRRSRQAGLRCFWQGLPFWSSQTWGNNCYLSIIFLAYSSPPPSHSAGEDQDRDWSWVHLWWIFQHWQWESGRQSRDKIQGELGLKACNVDGSDREL